MCSVRARGGLHCRVRRHSEAVVRSGHHHDPAEVLQVRIPRVIVSLDLPNICKVAVLLEDRAGCSVTAPKSHLFR